MGRGNQTTHGIGSLGGWPAPDRILLPFHGTFVLSSFPAPPGNYGGTLPPLYRRKGRKRVARVLRGAFLLVLFLVPFSPRPALVHYADPGPDDIGIMSWNIGMGQPIANASLAEHLNAIAGVIRESGVHIVLLQEIAEEGHLQTLLHQ